MKNGIIFNIQKFSVNDGPGIRTTVFLKGCPLNCIWCHNPESKSVKPQIFYDAEKCLMCGKCASVCPTQSHTFSEKHFYNRDTCTVCGKCADMCIAQAMDTAGYEVSVEEVMHDVLKDKAFYDNSGGGITLSGGEPMLQFDFALALMRASKEAGLHTCMETCGFAKSEHFETIAKHTDIFLFDYKLTDPEKHCEYTGVTNELILKNLKMLDSIGCATILRCPIIPTVNDTEAHFDGIAHTANKLKNIIEINIEPYHPLGMSKAAKLDMAYPLGGISFADEADVLRWTDYISSKTSIPVKKA